MIPSFHYLYNERGKLFIDLLRSVISPYFTVRELLNLSYATKLFKKVVDVVMKDRLHPDLMFQYDVEWKGTVPECVVKRVYETNDALTLEQLVTICKYGMQCNYDFFFDVMDWHSTLTNAKLWIIITNNPKFYDFTNNCSRLIEKHTSSVRSSQNIKRIYINHLPCDRCVEINDNIKFIYTEFTHLLMKGILDDIEVEDMLLEDYINRGFPPEMDMRKPDLMYDILNNMFNYIWFNDFLNELIANENEKERKIKIKIWLCLHMEIPNSAETRNWIRDIEAYLQQCEE